MSDYEKVYKKANPQIRKYLNSLPEQHHEVLYDLYGAELALRCGLIAEEEYHRRVELFTRHTRTPAPLKREILSEIKWILTTTEEDLGTPQTRSVSPGS